MKKKVVVFLLLCLLPLLGCEQKADDPDNAILLGEVYRHVVYTDSVFIDTVWVYTDCYFTDPVESVQVWVESDEESGVPYIGPDIMAYTDSLGKFRIPVYLGHTYADGYDYRYYVDVRVFCIKGAWFYDFGGGITLKAGEEFKLYPICLEWGTPSE